MALTRAQLLMGDASQGNVLSGQVQAVKSGSGLTIATDGTISVDSQTVVGLMKLGQTPALASSAYNSYNWPSSTGTVGQQITISSVAGGQTNLVWDDPDRIPWTAKGELVVGTGVNTETVLSPGSNGSILQVDSTTTSGLTWTLNFVPTTGPTGAANIPAGTTGQQPGTPATGAFRLNTTVGQLEFYNGTSWQLLPSSPTGLFVAKTSNTGSAAIPAGTLAQRDNAPVAGYFRLNTSSNKLEYYTGTAWKVVGSSDTGTFVEETVPTAGGPSAVIPAGTTAQRQTNPAPSKGYLRFNTTLNVLEVWDGTQWDNTNAGVDTFSAGTTGFTPNTATSGAVTLAGTLAIGHGGTGATTAPTAINNLLPTQGGNAGKYLKTDGTNVSWGALANPVTSFSAGTTGFTPSVATSGAITLAGTLNLAHGGTGATTQQGAANNILPPQVGNSGKYLTTDGTNTTWSHVTTGVTSFSAGTTGLNPSVATTGAITLTGTLSLAHGGTGATTQPGAANNILPSQAGNSGAVLTTNGTNVSWDGSFLKAATLAQAAAGNLNTVANTPETSVPKNAAGMTGAAIIPGGTSGQRPGAPQAGWFRFNTDTSLDPYGHMEVYTQTNSWRQLAYVPQPSPAPANLTYSVNTNVGGYHYVNNLTINTGVTLTVNSHMSVVYYCVGNVTINGAIVANGLGSTVLSQQNGGAGFVNYIPGFGYGWDGNKYSPAITGAGSSPGAGRTHAGSGGVVNSSTGGAFGGTIIIRALGNILMGASANIQANGGHASAGSIVVSSGSDIAAGAGGGSGGLICLYAGRDLTTAGSISAAGGNGSAGTKTDPTGVACGGGGGGGGWIILQADGARTIGSSQNVNGGTGGNGTGVGNAGLLIRGIPGGGYGGAGGNGGSTSGAPQGNGGGTGVVTNIGTPVV